MSTLNTIRDVTSGVPSLYLLDGSPITHDWTGEQNAQLGALLVDTTQSKMWYKSGEGAGSWSVVTGNGGGRIVSVLDYGAKGNGTTDDTTAIQAAMAGALLINTPVYFPPGTYLINTLTLGPARYLTIPDGTNGLRFVGENATIKFDSTRGSAFYGGANSTRLSFLGLKFQGSLNDDLAINIFPAFYATGNTIDVLIDGCVFDHCQPAFFTSDDTSARLIYTHNVSSNQPNALSPPGYAIISDNFFHDDAVVATRSHAIYVFGRAEHVIIHSNSFKNQADSCIQIRANDAHHLQKRCWQITGNYFEGCAFYGMFISALTSHIDVGTCVITDNIFKNVVSPMQLIGVRDVVVADNVMEWDYQYVGTAGNGIIVGTALTQEVCIARGVHINNNRLINRHPFFGVFTIVTEPAAGDTVTVGGVVYTWRDVPAISGEIARNASVDACAANLVNELQGYGLTLQNPVLRDNTDAFNSQNGIEGKVWVASGAAFAISATGGHVVVTPVVNNSLAMGPAIDVSRCISPIIDGNSIEGGKFGGSSISITDSVEPQVRDNLFTVQGGTGIISQNNCRPVFDGNHTTWSRSIAPMGVTPNTILSSYDAFPIIRDQDLVTDQDRTLPWMQGKAGFIKVGDGRARAYLFYGQESGTGNVGMSVFHWNDGDMMQLWDGAGVPFNFRFKRVAPNGVNEFNSYASLMALINTQTGGVYTASNPVLTYFGADTLAYGYIEIKVAAAGAGGNTHTIDVGNNFATGLLPKHRVCGVILDRWANNATNGVFRGGTADQTKTFVHSPMADSARGVVVSGIDSASQALTPVVYQADIIPGIGFSITHLGAAGVPTAQFYFSVQ